MLGRFENELAIIKCYKQLALLASDHNGFGFHCTFSRISLILPVFLCSQNIAITEYDPNSIKMRLQKISTT